MQELEKGVLQRDQHPALFRQIFLWRLAFGGCQCPHDARFQVRRPSPRQRLRVRLLRTGADPNCRGERDCENG